MDKETKAFVVLFFLVLFLALLAVLPDPAHPWSVGRVRIDEKENAFFCVKEQELNPWEPLFEFPIGTDVELRSKLCSFFGVKRIKEIEFLDRDSIKKPPPWLIDLIDRKFKNMKINLVLGGRA